MIKVFKFVNKTEEEMNKAIEEWQEHTLADVKEISTAAHWAEGYDMGTIIITLRWHPTTRSCGTGPR